MFSTRANDTILEGCGGCKNEVQSRGFKNLKYNPLRFISSTQSV